MAYIDFSARNCGLESGIQNADIAAVFADHPVFDVRVKDDLAKFKDRVTGKVFFATSYGKFSRHGDYFAISNPITINVWIMDGGYGSYINDCMMRDGLTIERCWHDETDPKEKK